MISDLKMWWQNATEGELEEVDRQGKDIYVDDF